MGKNLSEWLAVHLKPMKLFQGVLELQSVNNDSTTTVVVGRPRAPRPMCTICTDSLGFGDVSATRCGHVYHEMCLQRWLLRAGSCPQCRKPVCRSTLVRKLYFNFDDDQDESSDDGGGGGGHAKAKDGETGSDVRLLQEWLHNERLLVQDLEKKLDEERARYRLTRLFCCELKEAIRSGTRRESQIFKILQREVTELRLFASTFKASCDSGDVNPDLGDALRYKMDQLSIFLEKLRHRECHSVDFFFRRIWHLLDNIQRQSIEVRELRFQLEKTLVESYEHERRLKGDRDQLFEEMNRLRGQLTSALLELQENERQVVELAADNTSLSLMLKCERDRAIRSFWLWLPRGFRDVCFWRRLESFCRSIPTQVVARMQSAFVKMSPHLTRLHDYYQSLTREESELIHVQRATFCGCASVLSFYTALWLNLNPGIVLFATAVATGLIAPGRANLYPHIMP